MDFRLITVPYRYDAELTGLGLGPDALIAGGLAGRLATAGMRLQPPVAARLDPGERVEDRTALNIGRLGRHTAALVADARRAGEPALILAGDDTAAVGVVAGLQQAEGAAAEIGVVWIDAHGDFNTPETSISGILAGMPLAVMAGLAGPIWRTAAGQLAPIPTDRILAAGVRDLDQKEEALLRSTAARIASMADVRSAETIGGQIDRLADSCSLLMVNLDLDVLDPELVPSASTPAADGLTIAEASGLLARVLETGKVATVTLTSLNPGGGQRGSRSIASAMTLLERSLPAWQSTPAHPAML